MSELPKSWLKTNIGEVTTVVAGGTPKASDKSNFSTSGTDHAWLTPADLSKYNKKTISHGARDLSQQGLDNSSAKLLPKGTILFSSRAPIGYLAIAENEIATNQGFKNFVLPKGLDSSYTYYYLKSIKHIAESMGTGTTFKELSGAVAKTLPFILAPKNEQIRIANKLDSLLAKVHSAQSQLEKIPTLIKRFRQSVLAAATTGDLTEEWRSQNKIIDLLDYRQECIKQRKSSDLKTKLKIADLTDQPGINIPESWRWHSIDETCLKITDGTHHSPKNTPTGDYMYVTSKNVREGYIDLTNISYVNEVVHKEIFSRCDVKEGDVLYVKDGANTGLACVNNIKEEISLLSSVGVLKVCDFLNPTYLQHYLKSPTGRKLMLNLMGGTAIKRLTLTKIGISPISIPPLKEQKEIVRRVENLFSLADHVEKQYQKAKAQVDRLTQSILAKAFRGELVPQDPNDEPAEKLLERIKAEQEKLKKVTKKKVTKKTTKKKVTKKKISKKQTKKESIMKKENLTSIERALKEAVKPLTGQQLFDAFNSSYDSDVETVEKYFLELRKCISENKVSVRKDSYHKQDFFSLINP